MAKVFIEETTLTNIGNAIRDKEGTSELIPVTDMATRIAAISGGAEVTELSITSNGTYTAPEGIGYSPVIVNVPQDGSPPASAFNFTGNSMYRFYNDGWSWFVEQYGNQITTSDLSSCNYMFSQSSGITRIPFQLNVKNISSLNNMFDNCNQLKECPKIRGSMKADSSFNAQDMISNMWNIRDFEDLFDPADLEEFDSIRVTSQYSPPRYPTFDRAYSMRKVPSWFYKFGYTAASPYWPYPSYTIGDGQFECCYVLDEVLNFPVISINATTGQTGNMFNYTFQDCYRLKTFTFETDNGTPYVVKWKSQTIDLSKNVGRTENVAYVTDMYNSGITRDKQVKDDASYQALKDDPDWFTTNVAYSRYNHDSAVATINSLPDTSAYLASDGGTNTIKFTGAAGSATDGGAINTLTEAEIAVAAAKGWTVTLV